MVVDLSPSSAKASAPTQPKFADSGVTSGHRIFTMIAPDGTTTFTPSYYNTTEHSNLNTTKGFRIKCYNSLTTEGVRFNPSTSDFTNYHYFVLVYSDSATQHHFAKITEIMTEDLYGDAIEFAPKLGNEIPKGTKFLIIKGPHKTNQSDIAAFSAGIKDDLKSDIHCARPLFYMFDENLDKKGELNHNTKYYCRQQTSNLITNPSAFNTTNAVTFRTTQDFGSVVIDYSKFSHSVTMTDKLQALDNTISGSITKNEGGTVTADTKDYNEMFPNARRIADDEVNSPVYSGPTRYLHYDYSPTKANLVAGIYEHNNTESMDGKGGFSETSILDSARILNKKIQEFYPYRVRHNIHRGNLEDFIALKATYASTNSTNSFAFNTEYNLNTVLNAGDEVKIDDSILIVDSFGSLSGGVQSVAFRAEVRAVSDGVFASATVSPSSGATLQRRAYNTQDGTLMIDLDLIGNRFSKMYVALSSLNQNGRFATVTACDDVKGMLTLSMSDDSYYGKTLSFATGNYLLFIERFNGEVENIEFKKEEGQTVMTIQGRDKFNKLLSPVVNLNTLFSEDIIYSSNSPYNKLSQIDSTTLSIALGATTKATGIAVSAFDIVPTTGDKIFTVNGYIGEITSTSGDPLTINFTAALTEANSEKIYIDTEKNYVLSKALGSSHLATARPSSLNGSANKGIIFTAGNEITMSSGVESNSLVGSSANTNEGAIGYSINSPSAISKDFPFQAKLHDEYGSASAATFDTVNTLVDFEVVSTSKKDNITTIELAPYMPIAMGRKIENHSNTEDYTFTSIGVGASQEYSLSHVTSTVSLTGANTANIEMGKAVFQDLSGVKTCVGYILAFSSTTTFSTYEVEVTLTNDVGISTGTELFIGETVYPHHISLINGSHLWGGKILTMPHPTLTSLGAVPLNMINPHNSAEDTNKKFGQIYYKSQEIIFGNIGYDTLNLPLSLYNALGSDPPLYFESPYMESSLYRFSGSHYQLKPNISATNITEYGKTNTTDKHTSLDERGHVSVMGSNITDFCIFNRTDEEHRFKEGGYSTFLKRDFEPINNSALRNFLFITSDLLPYSSLRRDSLMDGNKTLSKYNLFLCEDNNSKDSSTSLGNRKLLKDSNFQSMVFTSQEDISELKRVSMIRLTEVGYDFLFNPFNVEDNTLSKRNSTASSRTSSFNLTMANGYTSVAAIDGAGTSVLHNAGNTNQIKFTGSVTIGAGDKLYDSEGHFIGIANGATSATHTLNSDFKYRKNKVMPTGTIYKVTLADTDYSGHGSKNSFTTVNSYLHRQKGTVIPKDDTNNYTDSHYGEVGDAYAVNSNSDCNIPDGFELALPIVFEASKVVSGTTTDSVVSRVVFSMFNYNNKPSAYKNQLAVCLDRYDIEDGGLNKLEAGLVTPLLGDIKTFDMGSHQIVGVSSGKHFKQYKYARSYDNADNFSDSPPLNADGMLMGMKLRLWVDSANQSSSDLKSSNGNVKKYIFDSEDENKFLEYCDLSGCYLVSEAGTNINGTDVSSTEAYAHSMSNLFPSEIIHIISHEIDPSNKFNSILVVDSALSNDVAYRIMQPNSVCMWDFTPKEIIPYMCSSSYTKMANENKTYNIKSSYLVQEGKGDFDGTDSASEEAYLSMYVFIDTDKQFNDTKLVNRSFDSRLLPTNNYFVSDGINKKTINISHSSTLGNLGLTFSETMYCLGAVSISESFTVSSNQELKITPTRACIGSTVSIGLEGEDLINELLEEEGIEFEVALDANKTPMYLAPNYQGVDLFSAIRYVLDRKEMKLVEENNVFKIAPDDDNDYYTGITIDDSEDFLIFEFEKVSTLFDFYNEINVYGNAHKATRKDIRSIQKRGRKTHEVVDGSLLTQQEVDKKALKLLRMHSTLNQKLTITLNSKGISQLRVGDIVNVSIPRENIEMSQYIVLEMGHELTGFITLQLGRYSKDLSDVFSELLISSKETKAALRNQDLTTNSFGFDFLESVKIKELKLLIRTRTASGGFLFGFTTALNTASTAFGSGGAITHTTLLDEDLV